MKNIPPFYIGQRVVCIKTSSNSGMTVKRDVVYIVMGLTRCACGDWKCDVGERSETNIGQSVCGFCSNKYGLYDNIGWCSAKILIPIEETFQPITLEKVIEEETKLISVN